jgi:hypothetical protein
MDNKPSEGYRQALDMLHRCCTPDGFRASTTESANYRRIWARDGVILSLAALLTKDPELVHGVRATLTTLARYQGPHGEIPSNVDPLLERVSFGGTSGRVDSNLWFIIGCAEYYKATGDSDFLEMILPHVEKVRFLLGAWEFNNRGLIYVPQAGDWADEYIQSGYILYDQLLYLQAQRSICCLHAELYGSEDHTLIEHLSRLRRLIRTNYWFNGSVEVIPDDAFHPVTYQRGSEAAAKSLGKFWLPFFSPSGYGYRFDAFANVLASLFNVADERRRNIVDSYIDENLLGDDGENFVLPAFWPVIDSHDEDWKHLQRTFSFSFRNNPYEFHNGGRWPMITGFHVAALAKRGKTEQAEKFLQGIHDANASESGGEAWSFPEFIHGKKLTPCGTLHQGWSAGAAIIAEHTLRGELLFRIEDHD